MSYTLNQAEASNQLNQNRCENVQFAVMQAFLNNQDPITGKTISKPINENGNEHEH